MSDTDSIFAFMSSCTGRKHAFGQEPFTQQRTIVSDVGQTDSISRTCTRNANEEESCITANQVSRVMLPLLWKRKPCLPRTGIFLQEEDMNMFQLDVNGSPAQEATSGQRAMNALSLGSLFFGIISFSDEELFFHVHPNKRAWHIKAQEMYGFERADMFTKVFSLSCAMPSCRYWTYFPEVRDGMRGGPAVLPKFVRQGLINEEPHFIRMLSVFLQVQEQGGYPLMCSPCLLEKQLHNRFTERLYYDPERPQLKPFTVVDLESESNQSVTDVEDNRETTVGTTSRPKFIEKYIERCKKEQAVGWQSDLYEENRRSYYLPRLPFPDIEIIRDHNSSPNGGYIVRWRNGSRK